MTVDQDKVKDVPLEKGLNTILLGISQGSGGWGFALRIRDEQGDPPSGLYSTVEAPK